MVAEIETIDDIVCMRIAVGNCEEKASLGTLNLDFVARYYRSPTSHWPSLSASEAQLLLAGLKIVAVWELASTTPRIFSRLSGVNDSTGAYHQAQTIGQPAGSAVYFAVNYDASGTDIVGPINDYFRGVAAGFAQQVARHRTTGSASMARVRYARH
jgi:hypothetical protein